MVTVSTSIWGTVSEKTFIVEYDTDLPVKTGVPYPISFTSLNNLFKHRVRKLGEHPSIYGRANIYAAICQ